MRVRRVVLHLGLHKTGSTLLQRAVLADLPHAVAPPRRPAPGTAAWRTVRRASVAFTHEDPTEFWAGPAGSELGAGLAGLARAIASPDGTVILSHEGFVTPDVFRREGTTHAPWEPGELTTVGHLRGLLAATGWCDVEVRVLLTIRRQAQYLASLFAQWSDREPGGQRAFARGVDHWLRRPMGSASDLLDLARLVAGLRGVAGEDAVTVLPLEAVERPAYHRALADALGTDVERIAAAYAETGALNARAIGTSEWTLRRDVRGRLTAPVDRLRQRLRRPRVRLTPGIEARVRDRYDAGNRRLDELVPFDLAALGYVR